jgi:hypothetical protein
MYTLYHPSPYLYTEFFKGISICPLPVLSFGIMDPDPMRHLSVTPLKPRTCGAFCFDPATFVTLAHTDITRLMYCSGNVSHYASSKLHSLLDSVHFLRSKWSLAYVCVCVCAYARYMRSCVEVCISRCSMCMSDNTILT